MILKTWYFWLFFFLALAHALGMYEEPAPVCECPPVTPAPFCQYLGSPVGGRLHQLPEGVGPHD